MLWNAVNTFSERTCSVSLLFSSCSGAVGGGVEVGMPLCRIPVFGDKHCCGRNVWKGHSPVSEWGRLCFLCASSREAVIHRPNTAKQRPKHKPALPFKMILVIFKHDLLYLWSYIKLLVAVSKQNIVQSVQKHCRDAYKFMELCQKAI